MKRRPVEGKLSSRSLRLGVAAAILGVSFLLAEPMPRFESAWSVLERTRPRLAVEVAPSGRAILRRITWEQFVAWSDGEDPARIVLADGRTLAELLGTDFAIPWSTIVGGGGRMSGGGWTLHGGSGQADAGYLSGGGRGLGGGFWHAGPPAIFVDGFESGDASAWTSSVGGP